MSDREISQQLTKYLTDAHSVEVQALAQLELAPRIIDDPALLAVFSRHLEETRQHERRIRELLQARGAQPSTMKDLAGRAGGWAMIAFARLNPDTPGKLTVHAFSYEHMELAANELLGRVAARAGDERVADAARAISTQERGMAQALAAHFDRAVESSLREKEEHDATGELVRYLRDAHAIEAQAGQLLQLGARIAGSDGLAAAFRSHLSQTRGHQRLLEERLHALGSRPSRLQDTALRAGALNLGAFFGVQPDTPVKLAGFAFAFEHLEIAAYELLERVAVRAGDAQTVALAEGIRSEERGAAASIAALWDEVLDAALHSMRVAAA